MNILPKIRKCPCCSTLNLVKVNGITYENPYQSLKEWIIKKKYECRKCREKIGLLINNTDLKKEKDVWFSYINCEDSYYNKLIELQKIKVNCKKENKKFFNTIDQIRDIQNIIQSNKVKLKIKLKIENKGMLIRNIY